MERLLRLAEFWNWLPAFRAVAEHEHLPSAAALLHVTPSALSRSIRQLEAAVGLELFHREGGRLRLTGAGEELLAGLRDSMRRLDDSVTRLGDSHLVGSVHVAIAGPYHSTVRGALESLAKAHPELTPVLHVYEPRSVNADLLRGRIDVVVTPDPVPHPRLDVEPMVEFAAGIFCGRTHPLYRARRVTRSILDRHEFVAPIAAESSPRADGWPAEIERRVAIQTMQLPLAIDLCAHGGYLATFPDVVVATLVRPGDLRKLPLPIIPPTRLYVVRRRRVSEHTAADVFVELLARCWRKRSSR